MIYIIYIHNEGLLSLQSIDLVPSVYLRQGLQARTQSRRQYDEARDLDPE